MSTPVAVDDLAQRPRRRRARAPASGVTSRQSWPFDRDRDRRRLLRHDDDQRVGLLAQAERRAMPRAERAVDRARACESGRMHPAPTIVSPRMITAPSCSGEYGVKIVASRSADTFACIVDPDCDVLLERHLALDRDDRADAGPAQPLDRLGDLVGDLALPPCARRSATSATGRSAPARRAARARTRRAARSRRS